LARPAGEDPRPAALGLGPAPLLLPREARGGPGRCVESSRQGAPLPAARRARPSLLRRPEPYLLLARAVSPPRRSFSAPSSLLRRGSGLRRPGAPRLSALPDDRGRRGKPWPTLADRADGGRRDVDPLSRDLRGRIARAGQRGGAALAIGRRAGGRVPDLPAVGAGAPLPAVRLDGLAARRPRRVRPRVARRPRRRRAAPASLRPSASRRVAQDRGGRGADRDRLPPDPVPRGPGNPDRAHHRARDSGRSLRRLLLLSS